MQRSDRVIGELTPQEDAVAQLVARGSSNREVAAELFVSTKTVQYHLTRIYAKLGIRSRSELPCGTPPDSGSFGLPFQPYRLYPSSEFHCRQQDFVNHRGCAAARSPSVDE